jgi:hypothetical protein
MLSVWTGCLPVPPRSCIRVTPQLRLVLVVRVVAVASIVAVVAVVANFARRDRAMRY